LGVGVKEAGRFGKERNGTRVVVKVGENRGWLLLVVPDLGVKWVG
jgi:hypothetical protein